MILIPLSTILGVFGVTSALVIVLIGYIVYRQREWQRRGVETLTSPIPLLGTSGELLLRRKSFAYVIEDIYNDIAKRGKKFIGVYQFIRPTLFLNDPKLIGEVFVKNFDHFVDRPEMFFKSGNDNDDMWSRSMLNMTGDEWRDMRHQLSPAFTASKLKGMLGLMEDTCRQLTRYLTTRANPNEPLNVKEMCRRFTADAISTAAFGSVSDSLNNNGNSKFFENGVKLLDFSGLRGFTVMGFLMAPKLMYALGIPFVPKPVSDFFKNTISETIKYREKNNKSRPDMVQLLLDARNKQNMKISDYDITAQAFTFFVGGFDTIATTLSFCIQLLAMHPEVQSRLRTEVVEALEKGQGSLSYEALNELTYMEMVLAEVLRLYPSTATFLERRCTKSLNLPEHNFKIEKGFSVGVAVFGMHRDPQYFPEPNKFDPERFNEENKPKIKPYTYLPFGSGPRNCIGLRYAQLEIKLCLAHVLSKVELEVCSKTNVPIYLAPDEINMQPVGGFWVNAKPIKIDS